MIDLPFAISPDVTMRAVTADDSSALLRAYLRNRDHLKPWEPRRNDDFFTPEGQDSRLRGQLEDISAGRMVVWVLSHGSEIVGSVALSNVALGPFRSANLGYWVDALRAGRGLATAAVGVACGVADRNLGLHRVDAGTLTSNAASQRVLSKCGFTRIGIAEKYLHIDGEWRDHILFQRILNDRGPF